MNYNNKKKIPTGRRTIRQRAKENSEKQIEQ